MTDDEIRALIRTAIAKHLGADPSQPDVVSGFSRTESGPDVVSGFLTAEASAKAVSRTISFARYVLPRVDDDNMCLIEPAVRCNHCGYCECHGH